MEEPFQATDDCQNDNLILPDGWRAILVENNRWLYLHETKNNCCWLPPVKSWISRRGLPYGWESARSNEGRRYYINHLTKETVRCLPSSNTSTASLVTPRTREVVISRHLEIGFGFVAGSERPVLIRSVAEDGPSAGKLHANDQILKINDEDVRDLPQADVILRIKNYNQELRLEVIANDDVQDVKNQGQRKSSIMSRTTRERRRSNPVSVRFAETPVLIQYVGSPSSYSLRRSSLPLCPNVLKIFLENGQTRSFLYSSSTTIKDLSMSLGEKIGLKRLDRFSLVLQSSQSMNDSYIQQNERASQIYLRRHCSSSTWLCKFHLVLAPRDIHFLLKDDPMAFDYFYKQVCSQVVEGHFGWELKYDIAIKLAALHIQQYALEDKVGKNSKISVKAIEKEVGGLDNFVPKALINTMQKKDLQRVLTQQIKQTRNLCPPGQKHISPLQAKLQYLKIVSEMKTYGGKQFNAIILDSTEDPLIFQDEKLTSLIFVGPNVGLAQVTNPRSFSMNQIAAFNQINGLVVTPHTEGKQNVKLFLTNGKSVTLIIGPNYETQDLVYLISGYCKYFVENAKYLSIIDMTGVECVDTSDAVPPYGKSHRVVPDKWNYKENGEQTSDENLKDVNFVQKPKFDGSEHYSVVTSGSEDSEPATQHHMCNGNVKTNLKIQEKTSAEESSPQKKDVGALKDFGKIVDDVDGHRVGKKARIHLSDDLCSEVTDEEEKVAETKTVKMNENDNNKVTAAQNGLVTSLKDDIPVVINDDHPDSVMRDMTNRDDEPLQHDDPVTNTTSVESTEIDIRSSGDSISSHQASGVISPTTSSVSPAASKDSGIPVSLSSNHVTMPLSDLRLNNEQGGSNLQNDHYSKETTTDLSKGDLSKGDLSKGDLSKGDLSTGDLSKVDLSTDDLSKGDLSTGDLSTGDLSTGDLSTDDHSEHNDKVGVNKEENPTNQVSVISIDINISAENTPQNINFDNKENDDKTDDLDIKRKGYDAKPERLRRRRLSSGYIPPQTMNGDIHRNIFTPECIILDDTPKGQESPSRKNNEAEITSRSKACDHALKVLYSLKTKLSILLHSKRSVRTNNEILRAKKQLMVDKIAVLEECIKQIQKLASTEEKEVVKAVLRSSRAFNLLTESCSLLYNAQYSMRHFTTQLDNAIDKHIDVLITTDAWNSSSISVMTVELHKDKCDLLHQVLTSLRKIINTL